MKLILTLFSVGLLVSCNSPSESNDLASSIKDANTILSKASSSIGAVGGALSSSFTSNSMLSSCEGMVSDLSTDASGAGEFLGCLLSANSKSPDTVLGSFHLVSEIIAMLEGQMSFEYVNAFTTHENISGSIDVSEGTQDVVVSLKERSVSGPWNYHIKLCVLSIDGGVLNSSINSCEVGEYTFEMYLKAENNQIGFKTIERFGGFNGGTSFLIDSSTEELRFEGWDEGNGRHTRGYAKGVVSSKYKLSQITSAAVATATQGIEDSGDGTDALFGLYDGTNLCINAWDDNDDSHGNGAGHGTSQLTAQGVCASFPSYDAGFFNAVGLEIFMTDDTKGLLDFSDISFGINQYFINN